MLRKKQRERWRWKQDDPRHLDEGGPVSDRFEPTPYDMGITDDPDATWEDAQDLPVPFTLTPEAEVQ